MNSIKQYATKGNTYPAIGCLVFLLVVSILGWPGHKSMVEVNKEVKVKENMRKLESRLQEYSLKHNGYYPGTIDTSFIQGMSLINPFNKHMPSLVTMNDTVTMCLELEKGQMAYMPLGVNSKGAHSYKIYGKGRYQQYLMAFRLPE